MSAPFAEENNIPMTTVRELPFEEWDKLDGLPFAQNGLPDPNTSMVLVAENASGEVVGVWSAITPIILEGLWVREDYRKTTVLGRMFARMRGFLLDIGITKAFTLVQTPEVRDLAIKGGFEVIPGDFMLWDLEQYK